MLGMPSSYQPTAKTGVTDDYRCFLLDPKLHRGRVRNVRDASIPERARSSTT